LTTTSDSDKRGSHQKKKIPRSASRDACTAEEREQSNESEEAQEDCPFSLASSHCQGPRMRLIDSFPASRNRRWQRLDNHLAALPKDEAMGQRGQMLMDKHKHKRKHKVKGIPSLAPLDDLGEVITTDSRNKVPADKSGIGFPQVQLIAMSKLKERILFFCLVLTSFCRKVPCI
jgi:hypothetical protein